MTFPGHIIKVGEPDKKIMAELAAGLAKRGYFSTSPIGIFDKAFKGLVALYQSQHADIFARPLESDGEVGSLTWGSIFSAPSINDVPTGIAGAALGVAISQIGVMEKPIGSNRGDMVDQYQKAAGLSLTPGKPGFFWCMAFVYWSFKTAGNGTTEFPKTAGCIDAWNKVKAKSPKRIITRAQAMANPALVRPGLVFILDHGGGAGHTGFVRQSAGGALKTVEGNTNPTGSANGIGVFELNRRKVMDTSLKGFLDFT